MDFIRNYLSAIVGAGVTLAWTCAIFVTIETLFLRPGARVTVASRLKAIVFWTVYSAIITLIAYGLNGLWTPLHVKPLLPRLAPPGLPEPLAVGVAAVASAFIGDFFYYWCHRAQHRFFWRFHAVHHSVREMSGLTAYHHFSEQIFEFALYSVPMTLFINSPYDVPVLGTLLAFQGNYLHSPTRLNPGFLGRYFADNRFHRIHHSMDPRHFDKNFGIFTTLWDSVFGTAYFPARDEWPATGVADFPEPQSVVEFLFAPFMRGFGRPSETATRVDAGKEALPGPF
jgi:sterol desaturase/sphingolipid hydroxylase (fatty acid hydroxylase superfamily)